MEKRNRGFTMIELLVAMVILVIAFGLVTYLYTKAARIRKIVVINSEVQQALSQMMDTLTYGETNSWGLKDAVKLVDTTTEDTMITAENAAGEQVIAAIKTVDDVITLEVTRNSTAIVVDVNQKIQLFVDDNYDAPLRSKFEYFDCKGNKLRSKRDALRADLSKTTLVKITFLAKSTDPAFKNAPLIPFVTAVRLCNKPSI